MGGGPGGPPDRAWLEEQVRSGGSDVDDDQLDGQTRDAFSHPDAENYSHPDVENYVSWQNYPVCDDDDGDYYGEEVKVGADRDGDDGHDDRDQTGHYSAADENYYTYSEEQNDTYGEGDADGSGYHEEQYDEGGYVEGGDTDGPYEDYEDDGYDATYYPNDHENPSDLHDEDQHP
jgi:hypothetical protein